MNFRIINNYLPGQIILKAKLYDDGFHFGMFTHMKKSGNTFIHYIFTMGYESLEGGKIKIHEYTG